ncbi:MAG: hypothetical protein A2V70_12315 [Planctomycetes bacterium RBG_13_63_9]|nr:MAG: hypothetical protein A2V70_12315 [Planctomycetes bacterium RBG_13_63_9]
MSTGTAYGLLAAGLLAVGLLAVGLSAVVFCAAAAPVVQPNPTSPWKSLFDGKKLGQWKVTEDFDFRRHGKVEVVDGTLVLGKGRPGTAVRYTGKLPTIDYELALEAMRVEGEDFFCGLTFPIGKSPCTLIVGGWGGPVVGLSNVDGEPAVENETTVYREFKKGRWYTIRLRVTKAKVEAWIDKEKIIDLPTKDRKFTIWFEQESVLPMGIATWETTGALRNIRVQTIGRRPVPKPEQRK